MFTKKTILLVSPTAPWPPYHGIKRRIYNLARWFKSRGHRVALVAKRAEDCSTAAPELSAIADRIVLATPESYRGLYKTTRRFLVNTLPGPIRERLFLRRAAAVKTRSTKQAGGVSDAPAVLGDPEFKATICPPWFMEVVEQVVRSESPDVLWLEYIYLSPMCDLVGPEVVKVIDTVEVNSTRSAKIGLYAIHDPDARLRADDCTREEEIAHLNRADVVIGILEEDSHMLRDLTDGKTVLTAGMDYEVVPPSTDADPRRLLLVASDNPLNVSGLRHFLEQCWPVIRAAHPDAQLRLVGHIGSAMKERLPGVTGVGPVLFLQEEYSKAGIVLNTTSAGTGLKIKTVEALCHSKPLISFPSGVAGLLGQHPVLVAEDVRGYADEVVRLLGDSMTQNALADAAYTYAKVHFTPDAVYKELTTIA